MIPLASLMHVSLKGMSTPTRVLVELSYTSLPLPPPPMVEKEVEAVWVWVPELDCIKWGLESRPPHVHFCGRLSQLSLWDSTTAMGKFASMLKEKEAKEPGVLCSQSLKILWLADGEKELIWQQSHHKVIIIWEPCNWHPTQYYN